MPRRRIGSTVALATLLFFASRPSHAQTSARDPFAALRSDSAAWQHVMTYVVQSLSTELLRAAADTQSQPWELRLPPAEPQRQFLEAQLRTILRARSIRQTDSITHMLEIGALRIVNDTALVGVQFEETRRCPATTRTTGFAWLDTVRVARHPRERVWGPAFSRATRHGDRIGC